ncbi:MAG: hypothetical protein CSA11_07050 [Chloroflexi bacterium]|nr:MAG: hypothetical protein CSB13_06145 [Chloroflexota bacterium]PIE80674.1 MAG: hypothetical protein CSA11_07050 [Chloroflexota bacterium]
MNMIAAILLRRCSHCRQGKIFRGVWRMNEDCPECGTHFEREQGYWMMSVFIGYVMFGVILAPLALVLYFQQVAWQISLTIMGVLIFLLALPVFVYARIIWLYIDELFDPRQDEDWSTPRDYLDVGVGSFGSNK